MQIRLGWNYSWNSAKSPPQQKRVRRRLMVIGRAMMQGGSGGLPSESGEEEPPRRSHPQRQNRHRRARRQRALLAQLVPAVLENSPDSLSQPESTKDMRRGDSVLVSGDRLRRRRPTETADKPNALAAAYGRQGGAMAAVVQPARLSVFG